MKKIFITTTLLLLGLVPITPSVVLPDPCPPEKCPCDTIDEHFFDWVKEMEWTQEEILEMDSLTRLGATCIIRNCCTEKDTLINHVFIRCIKER